MKSKEPLSGFLSLKRSDFYAMVKRTYKEQAELIDYVKFVKEPIYFDDYVPSPVLPIEERY